MTSTSKRIACGLALATAAMAVLATTSAQATTYIGKRTVGTGTVDLSVTTDGALGVLSASDITTFTVNFHSASQSFSLSSSSPGASIGELGSPVTATPTELLFDFAAPDRERLQFSNLTDTTYCLGTDECQGNGQGGETVVYKGSGYLTADAGNQVIASVPGVPEPATWAMMLVGFGGLGMAMRSRRRSAPAS